MGAVAVINIDDKRDAFERGADLGCGLAAGFGGGAIHLGQKGGDHRGAGGRFNGFQAGAYGQVQRFELLADIQGNLVAGPVTVVFGRQQDRHFAQLRFGAQEVMPHQAIEIKWRRGSGMGLHVDNFGQGHDDARNVLGHAVGGLNRRAFGQINHHRQFGFVVKGQQFDGDILGIKRSQRADRQHGGNQQKLPRRGRAGQHRAGHGGIGAAQRTAGMAAVSVVVAMRRHIGAARHLDHQPRRDDDGDEKRKDHRRTGIGGNRAHVGAHQARHEQHRQQGRNHRQGGDDGGVAHLGHGVDGGLSAIAAVFHAPVSGDVFDDNDGVIDKDADGKDQCKQGHTVQGIAHDPCGKEGQQDGYRDHDGHHNRLAPADGQPDKGDDRHGGKRQMEQQFVGFFIGGFAVVAGDGDLDRRGDQVAFQGFDPVQNRLGDADGIGACAFGDGKGQGGAVGDMAIGVLVNHAHDMIGRVGHKADIGHV